MIAENQTDTSTEQPTDTPDRSLESPQPESTATTQSFSSWGISGAEVARATAYLAPADRDLLRWYFGWATASGLSLGAAAERAGTDRTSLHRVFRGEYRGASETPCRPGKLLNSLRVLRASEAAARGEVHREFVETPTARRIWSALDGAAATGRVAMIWGVSQIGKTTALTEYSGRHSGVARYIRILPGWTRTAMLRAIATACRVATDRRNGGDLFRRVSAALDAHTLLIVDEVHMLTYTCTQRAMLDCLETLRALHDVGGCALVLCGTNVWRDTLRGGSHREKLEQLARRGARLEVSLPDIPTAGDLSALYAHAGLGEPTGDAAALMRRVAKDSGLTTVTEMLRFGSRLAARQNKSPSWEHVIRAQELVDELSQGR